MSAKPKDGGRYQVVLTAPVSRKEAEQKAAEMEGSHTHGELEVLPEEEAGGK